MTSMGIILIVIFIGVLIFLKARPKGNPRLKKSKITDTGQGQMGTARFSTHDEMEETFKKVEYRPDLWRQGIDLPEAQGLVVHCENGKPKGLAGKLSGSKGKEKGPLYCYVDDSDVHTLLIGASGIGKTAFFLYPNIEYAFASGMSFFTTDTKGDLYRETGTIGEKYYGYDIKIIDLRNPLQSSGYNMIYLVNKYMHLYKKTGELKYQAKAEKYAKITAKNIVENGCDVSAFGQNAYFYESAEGIVTATILLLAEFGQKGEQHIVSVFKLIQDLLAPSNMEGANRFQALIEVLPEGNRARFHAGAALQTAPETMQSVMSTAMSKLLSFLDSELEQILCFKNSIDVEKFCKEKTAIYMVLPEEDPTKNFIASLFIQQMYREMLMVADANGGKLDNRVMFYCDELGTMPKIDGLEAMFSAARSRKISFVAIIQTLSQFEKTYGREGAEIIADNCQNTLFGGFAPNSETAKKLSENLGNRTIENVSVTQSNAAFIGGRNTGSTTTSMTQRALMTSDELKNMPKGSFILMKTGCNPFKVKLRLFLKWGIKFEEKYSIPAKKQRPPKYADCYDICDRVFEANPGALDENGNVKVVNE